MGFPLIVYYDLRDDGTDPANGEHNFGLLARDYSAKPALHAVRTIASLAKERSLVGILQGGSTALHGLMLEVTVSEEAGPVFLTFPRS